MRNLGLIIIVLIFTSCMSSETIEMYQTHIIEPIQREECVKLTDLFCDFKFIPLENDDKAFVSDIIKLNKIGDNYYIYDEGGAPLILQFDSTGNFVRQVGRQGNAKDEYNFITDVAFNRKTKQTIVLTQDNKAKIYSDGGIFLYEKDLDKNLLFRTIESYSDGYICSVAHTGEFGKSKKVLYFFDINFNPISSQINRLPYSLQKPSFVRNGFQSRNSNFCFFDFYQSTFFLGRKNNGLVTDSYVLKSSNMVKTSNLYDGTFYKNPSHYDCILSEFYFGDYLYGTMSFCGKLSSLIINFEEDKAEIGTYGDWYPVIYDYDGEFVYSAVPADRLLELLDENSFIPNSTRKALIEALPYKADDITPNDNFLILKMKIKKRK